MANHPMTEDVGHAIVRLAGRSAMYAATVPGRSDVQLLMATASEYEKALKIIGDLLDALADPQSVDHAIPIGNARRFYAANCGVKP